MTKKNQIIKRSVILLNTKTKASLSLIIGFLSFNGLLFYKAQANDAQNANNLIAERSSLSTCYTPMPHPYIDPEDKELKNEINKLDALYKQGKINKETYNIRINKIKAQTNKLEDEYKPELDKE